MSLPKDINTLEKMNSMKNMLGDSFIEILKPSIKTKQNENVLKMLELSKDRLQPCLELFSVAIFHHNIPVIKYILENHNLSEADSPYINALSFHNSIFPDDSKEKINEAKESYLEFQIPFALMVGISGHVDIFEKFMNIKLIVDKKVTGVIGLSKKYKNAISSNVIGACAFYGHSKLLHFILNNYHEKEHFDLDFVSKEEKGKKNKLSFNKEYTGCTPALLAIIGPASDEYTLDVLKYLKEFGAKFDISMWNKENILHLAVKNNKLECAKYICEELKLKNLVNDTNKDGYTPLSLAQHLNNEKFISYFSDIIQEEEKKIEENLKELLAESNKKETTKKGKKKKGKKKGKNDDDDDLPNYMGDYQETLKEIVPKKNEEEEEENNKNKLHDLLNDTSSKNKKKKKNKTTVTTEKKEETVEPEEQYEEPKQETEQETEKNPNNINTPEEDDNVIIGLNFKSNKKNKKLKQTEKHKPSIIPKKEIILSNNIESEPIQEETKNNIKETKPETINEIKQEKETEPKEEIKKEKKPKVKKIKKEKRKDKEATDEFIEQMRKREKERQEEEKRKKEQEEKEREEKEKEKEREREEQQRLLEEEQRRKEQEEKLRQEELKKQQEEERRKKEEEEEEEKEEKEEKEILSYTGEDNNNNINNNISEDNKEEEDKEIKINLEDYENLTKKYSDLEERITKLEKEKSQLTSCLAKLYLDNKSKNEYEVNPNEENINDLMYLANKELSDKNKIINDLENKLTMLDLTNINHFSVEKLKKYKDFYTKNLQIVNNAMK